MTVFVGFAVAVVITSATLPPLIRRLLSAQRLDIPNERSSHTTPVPRGGGLAVIAGACIGGVVACIAFSDGPVHLHSALTVLFGAFALGALGAHEDRSPLPVKLRLGVQCGVAVGAAALLLVGSASTWPNPVVRSVFDFAVIAIAVVGLCNVVNFMDGINGISAAQAAVAGALFAAYGVHANEHLVQAVGAALVGAAVGFLPFNAPRARIFLGDSGSYFLGGAFALLIAASYRQGLDPFVLASPFALYLTDSGSTLLRRLARGARVTEPHREHTYQRLVQLGWSHSRTTAFVAMFMAAHATLAFATLGNSLMIRLTAGAAIAASLALYSITPRLAGRRRSAATSSPSNPA